MLRKMKIQMTPCWVILPRLTQRHTILNSQMQLQKYTPEMLQFNPQPRTVKQRIQNCQVLAKYNSSYQDDIFDKMPPTGSKVRLITTTDSSDSEDTLSVTSTTSSTGPLLSWPASRTRSPSTPSTPCTDLASFQHCAYLHSKLKQAGTRTWRRSSIRSWKSGRSRSDQFKKMVEQVKTATEEGAEMINS